MSAKPSPTDEVSAIATRLGEIQRRKAKLNSEIAEARLLHMTLEREAAELATEHLQLLRRFDTVAALP